MFKVDLEEAEEPEIKRRGTLKEKQNNPQDKKNVTTKVKIRNSSPKYANSPCCSIQKVVEGKDLNGYFSPEDIQVAIKPMKRCSHC